MRLAYDAKCLGLVQKSGMPHTECWRYKKSEIPLKNERKYYPSNYEKIQMAKAKRIKTNEVEGPTYAETKAYLGNKASSNFKCVCGKDGKYYHEINYWLYTEIYVYKSSWYKENNSWIETCASTKDMQYSYDHEIKHYERAVTQYKYYSRKNMYEETNETRTNNLFTIDLCQKEGEEGMEKFMKAFDTWSRNEYSHAYTNSPKTSDKRETATCPN